MKTQRQNRRALILAAGRGSRMRALTANQPKCLVELGGRSLLNWQLAALRTAGIQEIAVVTGYCAEGYPQADFTVLNNPRWSETNMVGSLLCASDWLEQGDCIISYADIVYHPQIIRELAQHPASIAVAYDRLWQDLWQARFTHPMSDAETFRSDANGRLLEIGRKPTTLDQIEGQYMGLIRMTPQGWQRVRGFLRSVSLEEQDQLDMTSLFDRLLSQGVEIQGIPISGRWCEVDSEDDLGLYQTRLRDPSGWSHDWRWNEQAA